MSLKRRNILLVFALLLVFILLLICYLFIIPSNDNVIIESRKPNNAILK